MRWPSITYKKQAATGGVLLKTVFLKISHYSQENTCEFLRAPILENICERLLLVKEIFFVRIFESEILALEFRNTKLLHLNYELLSPNEVCFLDLNSY